MIIKAVLFDLDKTLIDFTSFKKKATYATVKAMINKIENSRMNLG